MRLISPVEHSPVMLISGCQDTFSNSSGEVDSRACSDIVVKLTKLSRLTSRACLMTENVAELEWPTDTDYKRITRMSIRTAYKRDVGPEHIHT